MKEKLFIHLAVVQLFCIFVVTPLLNGIRYQLLPVSLSWIISPFDILLSQFANGWTLFVTCLGYITVKVVRSPADEPLSK